MEKKGKKDFRWRYQIPSNSDTGRLLDYIQNRELHPKIAKNEMILQALWTYYMPSVYSVLGRSPEEQKRKAYESVFALQSQIEKLIFESNFHLLFCYICLLYDSTRQFFCYLYQYHLRKVQDFPTNVL